MLRRRHPIRRRRVIRRRFRSAKGSRARVGRTRSGLSRVRKVTRFRRARASTRISKKFVSKVYRATTQLHTYFAQEAKALRIPAADGTIGFHCAYWNFEGSHSLDDSLFILDRIAELQLNGATPGSNVAVSKPAMRFFSQRTVHQYVITNQSTGRVNLEVYYLKFRKSLYNGESYNSAGGLVNLLQDGWYDNNLIGSGNVNATTDPALTPFQSARLVSFCHIYKVKKYSLHGGKSITFSQVTGSKVIHGYEFLADRSASNTPLTWDQNMAYIRGSKAILFKFWGSPCSATPGSSDSIVTSTRPEVDFWLRRTVNYRVINNPNGDFVASGPLNIGAPGVGGPSIVAEFGQTIGTETEA